MHRRAFAWIALPSLLITSTPAIAQVDEIVTIDSAAPARPFPHFWERMFGSGRAALTLRESYRQDLRAVRSVTAAAYVRFHGVLHDELGVYDEDKRGRPVYNFSYVDQIYDGLLASGVRPFVELSFMPRKLALRPMLHKFWYAPNVSPPKDYGRWDALITELARHLINRYGIEEVSQWYFEVWNEPNLGFWGGNPRQATYWELYDHTAHALKAVDARIRVGGPATAQAAWVPAFIQHCSENHVPVDFVSSHVYANDKSEDVFGTHERIPRNRMVCRAVRKVHDEIEASAQPALPLIWSEFNASYWNEPDVTDAAYMGPWLAETVRECDGLVESMSYWTFSDVFEEGGVVRTPFYGGFGLLAAGGIPKPSFNAFALLHRLGDTRLELKADSALLTRRADGALVLAVWNYAPPGTAGVPRKMTLRLTGSHAQTATVDVLDPDHGDVHAAYRRMGSPQYPTQLQLQELKHAAALASAAVRPVPGGELSLAIPTHGLALVTIQ
jgi:xylan 1,4-beta-xylosidase